MKCDGGASSQRQRRLDTFFSSLLQLSGNDPSGGLPFRVQLLRRAAAGAAAEEEKCLRCVTPITPGSVVFDECPMSQAQMVSQQQSLPACPQCLALLPPGAAGGDGLCGGGAPGAGCGEVFCSAACLAAARDAWHDVLCCAPAQWRELQQWARAAVSAGGGPGSDADIQATRALVAVRIYACILHDYRVNGASAASAAARFEDLFVDSGEQQEQAFDSRALLRRVRRCLLTFEDDDPALLALLAPVRWGAMLRRVAFSCTQARCGKPGAEMVIGVALYWLHAQMNHSCDPNIAVMGGGLVEAETRPFTAIRVMALAPIAPGDELCHSYLPDDDWSLKERRQHLWRHYRFYCRCARCEREEGDERRRRAAAGSPRSDAAPAPPAAGGDAADELGVD